MCVQGIDAQCVLQFTLIHAAGCALHRLASRVIHRPEWSFWFFVFLLQSLAFPFVNARFVFVSMWSAEKTRAPRLQARDSIARRRRRACVRRMQIVRPSLLPRAMCGSELTPRPSFGSGGHLETGTWAQLHACARFYFFFANFVRSLCLFRFVFSLSVMILPQVHLRKPCYDFYFL